MVVEALYIREHQPRRSSASNNNILDVAICLKCVPSADETGIDRHGCHDSIVAG